MAITHTDHKTGETVTTYVGRVLNVYRANFQAMSDVYTIATFATVVNDDGRIQNILVNANFECDLDNGRAVVDADPQALEIKRAHDEKMEELRKMQEELARKTAEERIRNTPVKGKKMIVAKGRKAPVGTVGVVAYIHSNGRVLLKNENEWQDRKANGVWVPAEYLKAV